MVENTGKETLQGFVRNNADPDAIVYTDEALAYEGVARWHESVRHSVGEYVRAMAHTNGIESFWAVLKRAHQGTFHKLSPKHLNRYVREFAGKHNLRHLDTQDQMVQVAAALVGKRLLHLDLIADNGLSSAARWSGLGLGLPALRLRNLVGFSSCALPLPLVLKNLPSSPEIPVGPENLGIVCGPVYRSPDFRTRMLIFDLHGPVPVFLSENQKLIEVHSGNAVGTEPVKTESPDDATLSRSTISFCARRLSQSRSRSIAPNRANVAAVAPMMGTTAIINSGIISLAPRILIKASSATQDQKTVHSCFGEMYICAH